MFGIYKAGARPGQHQLPLRRRRAGLPVGQRRRRRRRVPRLFTDRIERVRARRAERPHVALGRRRTAATVPGVGDPVRGGRGLGARPDRCARGAAPATTCYLLYTGGTTGLPEGRDVAPGRRDRQPRRRHPGTRCPPEPSADALAERLARPGPVNLPAAPADARHGRVQRDVEPVPGRLRRHAHRAAASTWSSCSTPRQRERVKSLSIVGDAFAKPMLRALDAEPDRWDVSSLRVIVSSGVMWSAETKAGLLRHNPRLIMIDSLGSSEAIGMANATTTADGASATARFRLGPDTRVLDRRRARRRARLRRAGPRGAAGAGRRSGTTRTRRSRPPPSW